MLGERAVVMVLLGSMLFIPYLFFEIMSCAIMLFMTKLYLKIRKSDRNINLKLFSKDIGKLAIYRISVFVIGAFILDIINFISDKNNTIHSDFLSRVNELYTQSWQIWAGALLFTLLISNFIVIRNNINNKNFNNKSKVILYVLTSIIISLIFAAQGNLMFWAT